MYWPLIALAGLSIIGGRWIGVQDLIQASLKEGTAYCTRMDSKFAGFSTAWPAAIPNPNETTAGAEGTDAAVAAPLQHAVAENDPLEHGEELVHKYVFLAFVVGIGLGFLVYMNGYWIAAPLMKIPPLNWIRIWLYRRMYFDELYFAIFVAIVMGLSRLSAWFDKYVVDGLVNLAGWTVRGAASLAGLNDKYVVDGAVNGAATLSQELGAAVRAPQTGRIRVYVTVLIAAVGLGLTAAIIVALSK